VENVSVPPEVEEAIDKRSSMAAVGNLNDFVKYQMGKGFESGGGGGPAGAAAELAVGFGLAQQMMKEGFMSGHAAPTVGIPGGQVAAQAAGAAVPELLSPAEAAQALGVSEADVMAVLESGDNFGRRLGRSGPRNVRGGGRGRSVRLDERVPFGQHQPVVLVQVAQRVSGVEKFVPGPHIACVEGASTSVRGEPHLAVPRARLPRKDHRHRGALVALVGRHREHPRPCVSGLEEHEVGRIGQVSLVVAGGRHIPVDGAVEADVEADERASLERERRLLMPAGRGANLPAAGLAGSWQERVA